MLRTKTVLRPLYDRIYVRRDASDDVSKGGIIIPDAAKEVINQGTIISAGPGRLMTDGAILPLSVKVGDKIMFGRYAGTDITVDGEKLVLVREDEIASVIEETVYDDGVNDVVPDAAIVAPPQDEK